jgi:hypothetical protein
MRRIAMTAYSESTAREWDALDQERSAAALHRKNHVIPFSTQREDIDCNQHRGTAAHAQPRAAVHTNHAAKSRAARREARLQRILVTFPRYLCVAQLALFLYLRLAFFPDSSATGLDLLWIGAFTLAAFSTYFAHTLRD